MRILRIDRKGFTSIELIIGLAVGAILILMIGAISSIGKVSFDKAMKESSVYNDVFSGLNLIKFLGREAHILNIAGAYDSDWKSQILEVDNKAFGLYQPAGKKIDFVYLKDKSVHSQQDVLLDDADSLTLTLTQAGKIVTVRAQGQKNKESFDLSTSVMRRN